MNKKILGLIVVGVLLLPIFPLIASGDTGNTPNLCNMLSKFSTLAGEVAGTLVVIGWVIVGILYLTASGAPDKIGTAKRALIAVVIGTIIVIIASAAYDVVNSALNAGGNGVTCEHPNGT